MNITARKSLKKLCREFQSADKKNSTKNKEINMAILLVFSIYLLKRIQSKEIIDVVSYKDFALKYNREISILSTRFPFVAKRLRDINLIPDDYFNRIANFIKQTDESSNNILAWTYQYLKYNEEKEVYSSSLKEGKKIEGASIAPATQFFTEDYMVEYLVKNTLQSVEIKELSELRVMDPACGGGNFLVYALEELYKRYKTETNQEEVLKTIIEKVLIGYDLDSDLSEIAAINIFLKISEYVNPEEIDFNLLIFTSMSGDEYGTLNLNTSNVKMLNVSSDYFCEYNDYFSNGTCDVLITNPPFMGKRNMGISLLNFLKLNYPLSKGDLCIAFLIRCIGLLKKSGSLGFVNQTSWMYLKSYGEIRKVILEENQIVEIVDLGSDSFVDINGEKTSVALTVIKNDKPESNVKFIKLRSFSLREKERILLNRTISKEMIYTCSQEELLDNNEHVFNYEGLTLTKLFKTMSSYKEFATPMQGTSTGDNKQFIDYAWNRSDDPEWVLVSKGGGYSKWSGLNLYKVKWGKNAEYIKQHPSSALRNLKYMKDTELVYSDTGTQGLSVRLLKKDQVFIASGPGIRLNEGKKFAHLAFLNSRLASYFLKLLSPKYTIAAGYIGKIPVTKSILHSEELADLGEKCYRIKENYLSRKLPNIEYTPPNFEEVNSWESFVLNSIEDDLKEELERLELEGRIEEFIHDEFNLNGGEKTQIMDEIGQPAGFITNTHFNIELSELDNMVASLINASCQYVSNKKDKFGKEGILEHLSILFNVSPQSVLELIMKEIHSLDRVKKIYKDDLFHKACLKFLIEKKDSGPIDVDRLADMVNSLLSLNNKDDIKKWILTTLSVVHVKAFMNKPIIECDYKKNYVYMKVQELSMV